MRTLFLLTLGLSLLLGVTACSDDDDNANVLQLDGANFSAPPLEAGTHRFAVRFDENELAAFDGRLLTGIRVFVGGAPTSLRLTAYQGGVTEPRTAVAAIAAGGNFAPQAFRDYTFVVPATIDASQTLWLEATVTLSEAGVSVGCDSPPNGVDGGQWLNSEDGWITFLDRGGENVNWNIRGLVE